MIKNLLGFSFSFFATVLVVSQNVWINEIDYDNPQTDDAEFIEIGATAGTNLSEYYILLVNGNSEIVYDTVKFTGVVSDTVEISYLVAYLEPNSLQNGGPDGLALIKDETEVLQYLSYEGVMDSTFLIEGSDVYYESIEIGSESNTDNSLQLIGENVYPPFVWELASPTPETVNENQNPQPNTVFELPNLWISEVDYDNLNSDTEEFISLSGRVGTDLSDYELILVNGNNSVVYDRISLVGMLTGSGDTTTVTIIFEENSLQNGSPDGIALITNNTVVEFWSYEGVIVDVELIVGDDSLYTSSDMGVSDVNDDGVSLHRSLYPVDMWYTDVPSPSTPYDPTVTDLSVIDERTTFSINGHQIVFDRVSEVALCNLMGQILFQDETEFMTVDLSGIYLLVVNGVTHKIFLD